MSLFLPHNLAMGISRRRGLPAWLRNIALNETSDLAFGADLRYAAVNPKGRFWYGNRAFSDFLDVPGASVSTGVKTVKQGGVYVQTAANTLPISDDGLLVEEARTNQAAGFNANPPALVAPTDAAIFNAAVTNLTAAGGDGNTLWGVVDDASEVEGAGLSNICNGRVYKIDNSAGASDAYFFLGSAGTSELKTVSCFAHGTGAVRLDFSSGGGIYGGCPAAMTRISAQNTPVSGGSQARISASPGSTVYFILQQYEAGGFATSPIITAGASVTRAADNIYLAVDAALQAKFGGAGTIYARGVSAGPGGSVARLFTLDGGSTANQITVQTKSATTSGFVVYTGGVYQAQIFDAAYEDAESAAAAWAEDDFAISADGSAVATDSGGSLASAYSRLFFGSQSGANLLFNGPISEMAAWTARKDNAFLEGRAA